MGLGGGDADQPQKEGWALEPARVWVIGSKVVFKIVVYTPAKEGWR